VIGRIKEHILTTENLRELVMLVNEEIDASAGEYRQRLDTVIGEMGMVNQRLERVYDALETGALHLDGLALRIQELRNRQDQLQVAKVELEALLSDRKVELADIQTVTDYVENLRGLLQKGTLAERKSFTKSFVREIRINGSAAELSYTIPLFKGQTQECVAVPPIVHMVGRAGLEPATSALSERCSNRLNYLPTRPT
jgi:site-specific DNA recombinase